jgi:hypothetical protein
VQWQNDCESWIVKDVEVRGYIIFEDTGLVFCDISHKMTLLKNRWYKRSVILEDLAILECCYFCFIIIIIIAAAIIS